MPSMDWDVMGLNWGNSGQVKLNSLANECVTEQWLKEDTRRRSWPKARKTREVKGEVKGGGTTESETRLHKVSLETKRDEYT